MNEIVEEKEKYNRRNLQEKKIRGKQGIRNRKRYKEKKEKERKRRKRL